MQILPGKLPQPNVPPKLISVAALVYPITRLSLGESGYAKIAFTIEEYGHTRDFSVLKTSYPYFASRAIAVMQKWQFKPASKNGRPVSCRARIPFTYQPHR
jgi:protein TonB